jgi:small subunit ribosomal protein S9
MNILSEAENKFASTGKRKAAIASVVIRPGKGVRTVNGREIKEYLRGDSLIRKTEEPLAVLNGSESYDVFARVRGGGLSGQAGALRLGIARALAAMSEENRKQLRKRGFLTRDSRVVERKKYGRAGARKRFQFSKR